MTQQLIDLRQIDFWLLCLAGMLVLMPVRSAVARKIFQALLNLTFLWLILGTAMLGIGVAIVIAYVLMRAVHSPQRMWFGAVAGAALAGLFVLHKLPPLVNELGIGPLSQVLSVIGFSYVALRTVELLRAIYEQRYPPPDILALINYLLPFHMLAAGPIQSYDEFVQQPPVPPPLAQRAVLEGVERITLGLFKKFVLAYALHSIFLTNFEANGIYFFLEVQVFFLWLYLDFSAYSDIAVGVGRLLGIATPENFNRPYLARNAIDFWNRWHISLAHFIRRNLFIPIQLHLTRRLGGRYPLAIASVAFSIAFVLCGLWHGLTINFLLWGVIHAAALVIANLWRAWLKKRLGTAGVKRYLADRRIKWLARVVTYEYVAFSLVVLFIP